MEGLRKSAKFSVITLGLPVEIKFPEWESEVAPPTSHLMRGFFMSVSN